MSIFKREKTMTIPEFLAQPRYERVAKCDIRVVDVAEIDWSKYSRGITLTIFIGSTLVGVLTPMDIFASEKGKITQIFDDKIWVLFKDFANPLAKVFMAFGLYNIMRNNWEKGWQIFKSAGFGLIAIYCIDGIIGIISDVGESLSEPVVPTSGGN